jgi:two-component system, chemotaxis family, CheB/CheR fusion protein
VALNDSVGLFDNARERNSGDARVLLAARGAARGISCRADVGTERASKLAVQPADNSAQRQANRSQDYVTPPFLVAAVGASSGGIEAFSQLISYIPREAPLAIILAQHLSRDRPSVLAEILAKRTALRVTRASDYTRVEVGHVYVIPPGKHMTVIDGHLRLSPRPEHFWPRQVDALFESLAKYYGDKSVGIILSGALSDGSAGFVQISGVGGVTIAQMPEEAQVSDMPRAAIATGDVDMVLPVHKIAQQLLYLATLPRFKHT